MATSECNFEDRAATVFAAIENKSEFTFAGFQSGRERNNGVRHKTPFLPTFCQPRFCAPTPWSGRA